MAYLRVCFIYLCPLRFLRWTEQFWIIVPLFITKQKKILVSKLANFEFPYAPGINMLSRNQWDRMRKLLGPVETRTEFLRSRKKKESIFRSPEIPKEHSTQWKNVKCLCNSSSVHRDWIWQSHILLCGKAFLTHIVSEKEWVMAPRGDVRRTILGGQKLCLWTDHHTWWGGRTPEY